MTNTAANLPVLPADENFLYSSLKSCAYTRSSEGSCRIEFHAFVGSYSYNCCKSYTFSCVWWLPQNSTKHQPNNDMTDKGSLALQKWMNFQKKFKRPLFHCWGPTALLFEIPPATIRSLVLRCHSRLLGTKILNIFMFRGPRGLIDRFKDPSDHNEQYHTQ